MTGCLHRNRVTAAPHAIPPSPEGPRHAALLLPPPPEGPRRAAVLLPALSRAPAGPSRPCHCSPLSPTDVSSCPSSFSLVPRSPALTDLKVQPLSSSTSPTAVPTIVFACYINRAVCTIPPVPCLPLSPPCCLVVPCLRRPPLRPGPPPSLPPCPPLYLPLLLSSPHPRPPHPLRHPHLLPPHPAALHTPCTLPVPPPHPISSALPVPASLSMPGPLPL